MDVHGQLTVRELKQLSDHVDYVVGAAKVGTRRLTPADKLAIRVVDTYRIWKKGVDAEDKQPD